MTLYYITLQHIILLKYIRFDSTRFDSIRFDPIRSDYLAGRAERVLERRAVERRRVGRVLRRRAREADRGVVVVFVVVARAAVREHEPQPAASIEPPALRGGGVRVVARAGLDGLALEGRERICFVTGCPLYS